MSETAKKSEKIASAIYLVTSFFDDKEPLKWTLRSLSSDLISSKVKDKISVAREIISLFSVAKTAGLVSGPNHDIVEREMHKYLEDAEKPLESKFFLTEAPVEKDLPMPAEPEVVKDKTITNPPVERSTFDERVMANGVGNGYREQKREKNLREFGAVSVKKSARQSAIINLLKRKKEIMIKDVVPLIEGVSEKTIQRELLAMVDKGILRKEGEKRWSRYSLA